MICMYNVTKHLYKFSDLKTNVASKVVKEFEKKETNLREYEILHKDFEICRHLKSRHMEKDLQEILTKLSTVLNTLAKEHIVDLNLGKWYVEGVDDPETIKTKINKLKELMIQLYTEDVEVQKGRLDTTIIPGRRKLI